MRAGSQADLPATAAEPGVIEIAVTASPAASRSASIDS
jgi:hypothetical protein